MIEQADIRAVLARLSKKWKQITAANSNLAGHSGTDILRCVAGTCCCRPVRKLDTPKPYPEKM